VNGCALEVYAANYCSLHLPSTQPQSPTGIIRKTLKLWEENTEKNPDGSSSIQWKFLYYGLAHTIRLKMSKGMNYVINVNNKSSEKEITGKWETGASFHKDLTIGARDLFFRCRVVGESQEDQINYSLNIDGFTYHSLYTMFLEDVFSHQVKQFNSGPVHFIQTAKSRSDTKETQEDKKDTPPLFLHRSYIEEHWKRTDSKEKTKKGYTKNLVKWNFTIGGWKEEITLEHSLMSGKRTIKHNDKIFKVDKPGILSNSSATYTLSVGTSLAQVKILKRNKGDQKFLYGLYLDGISFQQHLVSVFDLVNQGEFAFPELLEKNKMVPPSPKKTEDTGPSRTRTLSRNLKEEQPKPKLRLDLDQIRNETKSLDGSHRSPNSGKSNRTPGSGKLVSSSFQNETSPKNKSEFASSRDSTSESSKSDLQSSKSSTSSISLSSDTTTIRSNSDSPKKKDSSS